MTGRDSQTGAAAGDVDNEGILVSVGLVFVSPAWGRSAATAIAGRKAPVDSSLRPTAWLCCLRPDRKPCLQRIILHGQLFDRRLQRGEEQGDLLDRLFNPVNWFRIGKRTEWAVEYYEEHVFKGATYADLRAANGPLIVINASDLTAGVGFWFLQDNFDLLCSNILDFPISRAVAASSAVPGLFAPVVLENFDGCSKENAWLLRNARAEAHRNPELDMVLRGLESYTDAERRTVTPL